MQQPNLLYQSFQQAFYQHYEPLCQYAFTLVKEEEGCEDIVQEIFLRVWEKKKDLVGTEALRYYLYTATRNNCLTWLDKSKKSVVVRLSGHEASEQPELRREDDRPETDFDTLLAEALELLPPKCREVFVLSRVNKLTYQQIADTLSISIKTVENQMGKALKLLRGFIRGKQAPIAGIILLISFILMT
jgi:RNA polymerase sigma-70 factor (ECF subfamily)